MTFVIIAVVAVVFAMTALAWHGSTQFLALQERFGRSAESNTWDRPEWQEPLQYY